MTQVYHALAQQGGHTASHFPDWGNIPAYFGGLALLIAIYTLSRDHRDRRRSQAEKVAAWAERDGDGYKVFARNTSELPVTEVRVGIKAGFKKQPSRLIKRPQPDRDVRSEPIDVLPPGATETVKSFESGPVRVWILDFVDSSGSRWIRTNTQLRRLANWRIVNWVKKRWWRIKRRVLRRKLYSVDQD